ncbi:hypothetical protein FHP29_00600 [Nocardioides albidus]|uniref:Oxygen sensor histidine kinase NreB n=1 Tax=Nocardioides albidus TaxID=1517589 RepID=A0A5C4WPW3_9ACTN|nr:ATP-binding protein [Nocardioides albidus]TNM50260.1 hypothetical protein FHP29_00600 [Nocardioides albidus]
MRPASHLTVVGVAGAAAVASLAALGVTTGAGVWDTDPGAQVAVDAAVGIAHPAAGALMWLAGTLNRGARQLAGVLIASGLCAAAAALTTALALAGDPDAQLTRWWVQLQSFLWVPGFFPLLTLVPLLYPDGLRPGRVWRWSAGAAVAGIALVALGVGLYPEALAGTVTVPKAVTSEAVARLATTAGAPLLALAMLAGLVSLCLRYRHSQGLRRRQVVVLLLAAATALGVTLLQGIIPSPADVVAQAAAVALVPVAIGVAVTRLRLYDLDLLVCRALVAASLAGCLIGAYLTVFALVDAATGHRSALGAALAAGVAGVLVQPLGHRLTAAVDRLYFGNRADPWAITSALAGELTRAGVDLGDVPLIVCRRVVTDLRVPGARILFPADDTAAAYGVPSPSAEEVLELRHRGGVVGRLAVTRRDGERAFTEPDLLVLQGIADQAAPAVAALALHHQLRRSRESLVSAREEERRWLRQELHDGIGPMLAGLRLHVETVHELVDDPAARRLLEGAGRNVTQAVEEVRSICEGLRPPGIDDLGLPRALAALAERLESPELAVVADVAEPLRVEPAVEVALYRIAAEALANAAKHSRATRLHLVLRQGADVELEVVDDGIGIASSMPGEPGGGIGLDSMRSRADEVGGRLEVGAGADGRGTTIRVRVPHVVGGVS